MSKYKQQEELVKFEFPIYSKEDLRIFGEELEKYRITKMTSRGEVNYIDTDRYLKDQGALSEHGAVIVTGHRYVKNKLGEPYPICDIPCTYEIYQNKIEQWLNQKAKKDYAQKMELKELEKLEKERWPTSREF